MFAKYGENGLISNEFSLIERASRTFFFYRRFYQRSLFRLLSLGINALS